MKKIVSIFMVVTFLSIYSSYIFCEEAKEVPTVDSEEGIEIVTSSLARLLKAYNAYTEKAKSLGWTQKEYHNVVENTGQASPEKAALDREQRGLSCQFQSATPVGNDAYQVQPYDQALALPPADRV